VPRHSRAAPPPQDNDTALHQAVRYCQFATVKMLVDHGADISTKDEVRAGT
jgi:ankyrin repeat protein